MHVAEPSCHPYNGAKDIIVASQRPYGSRAVLKFSQ